MARYFAPITPDELEKKFKEEYKSVSGLLYGGDSIVLKDLRKVEFDGENSEDRGDLSPLGKMMGIHTLPNGLTYWGMTAGGDWEHPVFFIVYWDGKQLRGYVPKDGNVWNYKTNKAFGNEYDDESGEIDEPDFDFDPVKIAMDIEKRILPKGVKTPAKAKKPAVVEDKKKMISTSGIYDILMGQYGDFEEGSEVGDAISGIVCSARVLAGIGHYSMACQLLLQVRDLAHDDLRWRVGEEGIDSLNEKEKALFRMGC